MSREIKFRGYDGADWIYGSAVLCDNDNWYMIENGGPDDDWVMVGKVGQYTGLTDKNGVEIYEGDIIKVLPFMGCSHIDKPYSFEIKFVEGKYVAEGIVNGFIQTHLEYYKNQYEVIGNIYENPELLSKTP